jgi:hypothetical protein
MLCRSCLDKRRTKCITCGSDIYGLYKMCLFCHRTTVVATMREELRKRTGREGLDYAAVCRQEAWYREREASKTDDADKKTALMELVDELRKWANDADERTLAAEAPVPIIDRQGKER